MARPSNMVVAGVLLGAALIAPARSRACDLCAIYTATEQRESRTGFRVGVAEQFTSFNTLQNNGQAVGNPAGEWLNSSITQFLFGYNFTPRLGLQLNVPLIARVFRRQEMTGIVNGDETGIGDLSLLGHAAAFSEVTEHSVIRFSILGGLKLPSGNSHRLKEERGMAHAGSMGSGGAASRRSDHANENDGDNGTMPPSGIHGHELALGSGSVDGIIGTQLFVSWQRLFWSSALQYLLRTEGDFTYQHANDLLWSGGPGAFVLLSHNYSLGVQAVLSGESKGNDTMSDVKADDTAITALYIGPGLLFTWGTALDAELGADLPVVQNNSALQIVPDYRLRGGLTWRF